MESFVDAAIVVREGGADGAFHIDDTYQTRTSYEEPCEVCEGEADGDVHIDDTIQTQTTYEEPFVPD
ncbi:hypothetical protein MKW98_010096, partial [Papaver atlanticum]